MEARTKITKEYSQRVPELLGLPLTHTYINQDSSIQRILTWFGISSSGFEGAELVLGI